MVYKRYIQKKVNGKTKIFGPYYYESYRDKNGKSKTRYLSKRKDNKISNTIKRIFNLKKSQAPIKVLPFMILFCLIFLGIFILADEGSGDFTVSLITPNNTQTTDNTPLFEFNVTGFTVYSAGETPTVTSSTSSSSSGSSSSGGTPVITNKFELDKNQISVKIKQGEVKTVKFMITNPTNFPLNINLSSDLIGMVDVISNINLTAKESKIIELGIFAKENLSIQNYLGTLSIQTDGFEDKILLSIDVSSKENYFDLSVETSKENFLPGEKLSFKVFMTKMRGITEAEDITIEYYIKNEKGEVISSFSDTRAVATTLSFVNDFEIPKELEFGRYLLEIKIDYHGEIATASDWFNISDNWWDKYFDFVIMYKEAVIGIFISVFIILLATLLFRIRRRKLKRRNKFHNDRKRKLSELKGKHKKR